MKTYKTLSSVIRSVVTEAYKKDDTPFEPDEKSSFKKPVVTKTGNLLGAAGMNRAKALARKAMQQKMQQKMKESFDLDISEEEADDLLNSIQEAKEIKEESEWMRTMHFKSEDHEREAAKHLSDADAHKKSGNMPEHYAAMINHYTSKARALEKKTPLRGTGPKEF
jgi:hypothetical protein